MQKSQTPKTRTVQIRVSEQEEKWLEELAEDYGLDRSKLILFALRYISENRPHLVIRPQGKELALAGLMT